jgi:catalase
MLGNLVNVDETLAARVAAGLNVAVPKASPAAAPVQDFELSPALRVIDGPLTPDTIKGRAIGLLVTDGADAAVVASVTKAITHAGGKAVVISPKVGGAKLSDGKLLPADGQLAGTPSVMVDAIALIVSEAGCAALLKDAAAVQFVMDAFGHLKTIGHTPAAQPLLDKAGVVPDEGVVPLDKGFVPAAAKRHWQREPTLRMLA